MPRRHPVYQWAEQLAPHFPELSRPQVTGLALWSYGIVLAGSCALTAVLAILTVSLAVPWANLRSRLKEWYLPAEQKAGSRRVAWEVRGCFASLLNWVLATWPVPHLALALDATHLGDRFTILVLSVVDRSSAIPVAWKVLPANVPHPWEPEWIALLEAFRDRLSPRWSGTVIVLTDRGLYARWLFRAIVALGWHPMMRITRASHFRPAGWVRSRAVSQFVPAAGQAWQGRGLAFPRHAERRLECTLLVLWAAGHAEGWYVLTDLAPAAATPAWYGLRSWIEAGFRHLKSGGWHWERTRMTDPSRVERLWLAVAVAECWVQAEAATVAPLFPTAPGRVSTHRRGIAAVRGRGRPAPRGPAAGWTPEPWPDLPPGVVLIPCDEQTHASGMENPPQ